MKSHPKVSICVPNLNTRPYLQERFETIFNQTFRDWELIAYDNYSEDGAWEFFQEQAIRDKRIRISQAPREGLYANWNNCLREAVGEYVYIATSDDTMMPDCLEKMVAVLEANPDCGLCHCNLAVIDEAGNPAASAKPWNQYDGVSYFGGLIYKKHIRPAPHDGLLAVMLESVYLSITQVLIRRSLFEKVGLFESKWGSFGDYAWQIRAGLLTNTVHIPEILATWRQHPSQASQYDKYLAAHASGTILQLVREAMAEALSKNPGLKKYLSHSRLTLPLRQCAVDALLKSAHGGRQTLKAWVRSLIRDPHATIRQSFSPYSGRGKVAFARTEMNRLGVMPPFISEASLPAICPVCGSGDCKEWTRRTWTISEHSKAFTYFDCKKCRSIFCNPMPSPEELGEYYAKHFNYQWYQRRLFLKKAQALHRWKRLESLFKRYRIQPGNLLDIGCGHGMFVQAAARSGWRVKGLDYPSKATTHAKNILGLDIVEDDLIAAVKSGKVCTGQFDFITAWHCLEHCSRPVEFLSYAVQLLKPGGKLLLAVPNADAHGMKQMREDWVWCQEPFVHVVHYHGDSLAEVARRAGLDVVSKWSRDTWDANRLYDEGIDATVRNISKRLRRLSSKLAFGFTEGSRLLFYIFGCMNHWLLGNESRGLEGSELLLLAERPYKK